MSHDLGNLLTERILSNDFKLWLISDTVESCNERADFIPYFLNYVKENCAWLISKDAKCLESPSSKLSVEKHQQPDNISVETKRSAKKSFEFSEKNRFDGRNKVSADYNNSNKSSKFHGETKVKPQSIKSEFNSKDYPKIVGNDKNTHKSQHTSRKSLNSRCGDEAKSGVSSCQNVQRFEENIQSFDAFPPLNQNPNTARYDPKKNRRITPTPVQVISKGSSKFGTARFPIPAEKIPNDVFKKTPLTESPNSSFQTEREMLKVTRNIMSQCVPSPNNFKSANVENKVSPVKHIVVNYIVPNPEKISHKKQLEAFSSIYEALITNALVPNVTSELYFIFELLTSKMTSEEKCDDNSNIFCTVHNCVFFCITVLTKLQHMLNLLDKNTLFSLCEIPFLSKFSPELVNFLRVHSKEKQETVAKSLSVNRVPFLLEEDSRENFIDAHSFTNFRKQRDLFYELLRDWQQQPLDCIDGKFHENFTRKAKLLINLGPNVVNLHHLARLFQNQLIASCLGLEVNEVYDDFLSDIQRNFPDKFEKLHQRFMMPFCVGEPNPPPTFYGIQAFFSELIQAASSVTLNQHLQDIFVSKILEFNSVDMYIDGESNSIGTVKEQYIFLLHTLRLLGKFLGHLYFLPYKAAEPVPASIVCSQLNSRKSSVPPLDILQILKTAVKNNRVILTVPWIVEYLSMIDPVGKNLPFIDETLAILASIYRGNYIFPPNSISFWFLRITIGWLFDVLCYPIKYCSLLQPIILDKSMKCESLDLLPIIDKQLVHSCCPYLTEFKVLVHSYLNGVKNNKRREIRKITPLSTTKQNTIASVSKQQLETQLEDNFFFLHPPSLKKTVEFVSERIASKSINKIRSEVTEFKLNCVEHITRQEKYKEMMSSPEMRNATTLKSFIDSCVLELYEKSQSRIAEFIHVQSQKDIERIMPDLLSDDVKPPVLKMSSQIAFRLAVDKVVKWCDVNLVLVDIKKDIKNKLNHLSKGDGDVTKENKVCITSVIISLRDLIRSIGSSSWPVTEDGLQILSEVLPLMDKKIGISAKKLIACMTVDLYIELLVHYPEKCDDRLNKIFVDIWLQCSKKHDLGTVLLGVQNVKLLLSAKDFDVSCKKLNLIVFDLIRNGCLPIDELKDYLIHLQTLQWKDPRPHDFFCFLLDDLKKLDLKI